MGPNIQTQLHIPELWFDFYARFLPGAAFIAVARIAIRKNVDIPGVSEIILLAFAGYLCAMVSQPVSSRITIWIEKKVAGGGTGQEAHLYVRKIQERLRRQSRSRRAMILSKMHGETTLFVQLFVLGLVFLTLQLAKVRGISTPIVINLVCLPAFLAAAREVSGRRFKRAEDIVSIDDLLDAEERGE